MWYRLLILVIEALELQPQSSEEEILWVQEGGARTPFPVIPPSPSVEGDDLGGWEKVGQAPFGVVVRAPLAMVASEGFEREPMCGAK